MSFDVSRRLLAVAETLVRNVRDDIGYRSMRFLHHYMRGDWSDAHEIAPADLEEGLRFGTFWEANTYLGLACERRIHRGDMTGAHDHIARIARIGDEVRLRLRPHEPARDDRLSSCSSSAGFRGLSALERYYAIVNEEALNLLACATRARDPRARGRDQCGERRARRGRRERATATAVRSPRIT